MANPWPHPPAHANPPRRPWYKKKRFIVPILLFVGLGIIGSFIDEPATTPTAQAPVQVVDVVTAQPTTKSTAEAEAIAAEVKASASAKAERKAAKAERKAKARAKAKARKAAKAKKARAAKKKAAAEERRRAEAEAEEQAAEEQEAEEEEESTPVYYENCTAVRNAGAAPIHSGDPGYASHLDRDGDGVGCE
jgi:hypothetical protein